MKKNRYKILFSLLILLLIFFFFVSPKTVYLRISDVKNNFSTVEEFSGVVTAFTSTCEVDGACVAVVDGKTILTNPGDVGNVIKLGKSDVWKNDIGMKVKVRAIHLEGNQYTLVGREDLYVLKL